MTQHQMAELLLVHRSTISMAECGLRVLPARSFAKMQLIADTAEKYALHQDVEEEAERTAESLKHDLEVKVVLLQWKRKLFTRQIQKMKNVNEAAAYFLKFLSRELYVFSFDTGYSDMLKKWYEKALMKYNRTIPCYRDAIAMRISNIDDRLVRISEHLVVVPS